MTLRRRLSPLRPDLDNFLFATVGDEINGVPLSVVSVLVRLGLDPREEADRLSSMTASEATEQLARLIAELPGIFRPLREAREIAGGLVGLLPRHDVNRASALEVQIRPRYRGPVLPKPSQFWIACIVVAAAALASAIFHRGFPFGIGSP